MNRYLNLMSDRARLRESMRRRVRQWSWILAATVLVLTQLGLVRWWSYHREEQQREALEAQYEPIRQLKTENTQLQKKMTALHEAEQIPLTLANEKPLSVLLGLVGKAVAGGNQQVYVQHLNLQQEALASADSKEPLATVVIEGVGLHGEAVAQLTSSLRAVLPFALVELASTQAVEVDQQTRQSFTIHCSY